jgi:hypothetical protein
MGRALKKFMCEAQGAWPTWVPITQMGINDHVSSRTQTRPFSLMFNRCFNEFFDFSNTDLEGVKTTVQDRVAQWKQFQQVVIPAIAERTSEYKQKMKDRLDSKSKIVEVLEPGTVVWALDHTRKSKWDPIREGPFTVVRRTEGGAYELMDSTNTILPTKRTIEMLTVQEPVLQEEILESYEVQEVLKHQEEAGGFKYLVRWKGCSAAENSWVPQDRFDDVVIIRDYWERVNARNKKGARRSKQPTNTVPVAAVPVQKGAAKLKKEPAGKTAPESKAGLVGKKTKKTERKLKKK